MSIALAKFQAQQAKRTHRAKLIGIPLASMPLDCCSLSPDEIGGVRFTAACFVHDVDWSSHHGKVISDLQFRQNVDNCFRAKNMPLPGALVGWLYLGGVATPVGWFKYLWCYMPWTKAKLQFDIPVDIALRLHGEFAVACPTGPTDEVVVGAVIQALINRIRPEALDLANWILDNCVAS